MGRRENYIEALSKMINVETIDEGETSNRKFIKFQAVLKDLFPHVFSTFTLELFHYSILLSYITHSDKQPVLLMSHQDVVPANGTWVHEPFKATLDNGKLYGRGSLDTKSNLFAIFEAVEELLVEGYKPARSLYIASSRNEETSSEGIQDVVAELQKRQIRFDFVLDEGGMIIDNFFIKNGPKLAVVALGEKAIVDLKFTSKKHGGHASTPDVDSSLLTITRFMQKVQKYKGFDVEIPEITHEMLHVLGKYQHGPLGFILRHTHAFKWLLKAFLNNFNSYTKAMIKTTVAFTVIKGSDAYNVIPDESYVVANIRVSHKEGSETVIKKLKKIADRFNLETEVLTNGFDSNVSSCKSSQFNDFKKLISKHFPDALPIPYIALGASDSRYTSLVSDNVFRFAPFKINDQQMSSIHSIEENVDISALEPAVDFFKDLVKGL